MATANPLPPSAAPWSDGPLDDLSHLSPDVRATIEAAERRVADGTARLIPLEDVPATLDALRRAG